jgi:hypothetical protein
MGKEARTVNKCSKRGRRRKRGGKAWENGERGARIAGKGGDAEETESETGTGRR